MKAPSSFTRPWRPAFLAASMLCFGLLTASPLYATNGYSPTGFGTTNKGLAGAGVAFPQDALTAATNPAGMVFLGTRMDVGAALFNPERGFTANADGRSVMSITPGTYDSNNDLFAVPHFGWSWSLRPDTAVGISVGGNGGMNTEYDAAIWENFSSPSGPRAATSPTGVDFAQVFVGFSLSYKINERNAVGIMPLVAYQRFKAEGLEPFTNPLFTVAPDSVNDNGYDDAFGYGVRVGWLGQLTSRLTLGASYQTRTYMSEFDKYAGLFAEQGDFDIPPTAIIGLAFKVRPDVTLVMDVQRIFYGDVKSLGNSNEVIPAGDTRLGADNGLGFGWNDMDIFKLGIQWDMNTTWTLRAGYSAGNQLFDNSEALFNILAPATIRDHASFGLTYRFSELNEINLAYTHALNEKVSGQNPIFTGPQTGSVEMDQNELELSWGHRF